MSPRSKGSVRRLNSLGTRSVTLSGMSGAGTTFGTYNPEGMRLRALGDVELVKAVHGRQMLVAIADVVLAELPVRPSCHEAAVPDRGIWSMG